MVYGYEMMIFYYNILWLSRNICLWFIRLCVIELWIIGGKYG